MVNNMYNDIYNFHLELAICEHLVRNEKDIWLKF